MDATRAATYSLLAHIRDSGTLIKGPIDIFIPLIKKTLSKIYIDQGITKNNDLHIIKKTFDELFNLDIPFPPLKLILKTIAIESNLSNSSIFQLYDDGSYLINDFIFHELDESISKSQNDIKELQILFSKFCEINSYENKDIDNVVAFIENNKIALSKYLNRKINSSPKNNYLIEAKFINYFKGIPDAYEMIKNIYIGSILSSYLIYETHDIKSHIELLLDTNFIVSLIDLNTPESTHTCNKLVEIGLNQGYRFSVLKDTIEETQSLLTIKAQYLNSVFLQSRINPEDIYNACFRRKLKRSDLEIISSRLEKILNEKGINIIYHTEKYKNKAKYSHEYEAFRNVRNTEKAALHDATALQYVQEKRSKKIHNFEDVNCWFVHNSNNSEIDSKGKNANLLEGFLPETIKVDELLNILWLSNPSIKGSINDNEIAEIGITSLIAFTLNENLPKSSIIKELDENIQKCSDNDISDEEILLFANRIVNGQIKNIAELNNIAKQNNPAFVKRLKEEANKQKEEEENRRRELSLVITEFRQEIDELKQAQDELLKLKIENEEAIEIEKVNTLNKENSIKNLAQELENQIKLNKNLENKLRSDKKEIFLLNEKRKYIRKKIIGILFYLAAYIAFIITFPLIKSFINSTTLNFQILAFKDDFYYIITCGVVGTIVTGVIINYISNDLNSKNIKEYLSNIEIPSEMQQIE